MGKLERRKDAAQEAIESTSIRVGRIATIITTAVADVAREVGDAVSDALEMRQAAKAAAADEARRGATSASAPSTGAPAAESPAAGKPATESPAAGTPPTESLAAGKPAAESTDTAPADSPENDRG